MIRKKNLNKIKKFINFSKFIQSLIKNKNVYSYRHTGRHVTVNTLYELQDASETLKKVIL